MFKFLRRYNKWILAIGGVLLMITFLIPQAIDQLARSTGARGGAYATVGDGEKVSAAEFEQAQAELRLMLQIGIGVPGLGVINTPEHWYLLVREAEAAGLVATGASVQFSDASLSALQTLAGDSNPDFVRQTLAKADAVAQLIALHEAGGVFSDYRLKHTAKRLLHVVYAQLVVIEADPEKADTEPTEEEINEHFATYAEVPSGEGEPGFGYKLPDRVKLEWLTVSAESVRRAVEQSEEFSSVAQRIHWRRNPDGSFPPLQEGGAVPDAVREDLLNRLTQQKREEIAKYAGDQLRLALRGVPEPDGHFDLPADWDQQKIGYPDLAERLRKRFGIDLPAYESSGERWLQVDKLADVAGLGSASTDKFGNVPIGLQTLVAGAREFGAGGSVPIQNGVAGPPLRDADGNEYLFRILATDPSRPPNSVDEVKDDLVRDLKRLAHYRRLEASVDDIRSRAISEGILSVAVAYDSAIQPQTGIYLCNPFLVQRFQPGQPISAVPSPLPTIGAHRPTIEAIIDHAVTLPFDKAMTELTNEERTVVVTVKDKLCVIVAQLTRQIPLSQQAFADLVQKGVMSYLAARQERGEEASVADAFSYDALVKRHNFALRGPSTQPESESVAPAEEPSTQASTNAG